MNKFRLSLDKSSKKFICPTCNKRTFVRYKDYENGTYFEPDYVGRCDRENKCGYHYSTKEYYQKNPSLKPHKAFVQKCEAIQEAPTYIDASINQFYRDLTDDYFYKCSFFQYLFSLFSDDEIIQIKGLGNGIPRKVALIISQYKLTTSGDFWIADGKYSDGVMFWQFDIKERIRTAKVMRYNPTTGKRIKRPKNYIHWIHSALKYQKKISKFNLHQCFFGEHLLNQYPSKKVAIVESEKTACIMSQILTEYVWLATGGSNGAKWTEASVYSVLRGREVVLFPDLGQYNSWNEKSKLLQSVGLRVECSNFFESSVSHDDKKNGYDIADFAIANEWYR